MSHFIVVVCVKDPDDLERVLAPYDENMDVEPYRVYEDGGPAEHWSVKHLREESGLNPDDATLTWQQVADAYNARYGEDDEKILIDDDGRAYTMSTRNPQAKWDWWQIGGRWGGYFPYKPEHAHDVLRTQRSWSSPSDIPPMHCDGGPKRALNLAALQEAKADTARAKYAEWHALVDGTPEALPWPAFADNVSEGNGYTIEQARQEYRAQPRVQAYQQTDFRWYDDPISEFGVPEELYVERARSQAIPGFATLTLDGRWLAPGRMGWFAATDATDSTRAGYAEVANAYIDSLDDDVVLVAVDCHI